MATFRTRRDMSPRGLRPDSKFKPFTLKLANNATLTGISCLPASATSTSEPVSPSQPKEVSKPLLVIVHGGKCTPYHFDLDKNHTYSSLTENLGIPVVAIHRPGYGKSTSFLPVADEGEEKGENLYHLETARWLHQYILPVLWADFGRPLSCSGVVLVGHSMGGMQILITAALSARDSSRQYPLAGIVLSGMGCRFIPRPELAGGAQPGQPLPDEIFYDPGIMEMLMLNNRSLELCDEHMYARIDEMDVAMPKEEVLSLLTWWPAHWKQYAGDITVPVVYGLGDHDWLWETSQEHIAEFGSFFKRSESWDGDLVKEAPHCIDWSRVGHEWIERVGLWSQDAVEKIL